jgi:AMMECR1 domain-containing protein
MTLSSVRQRRALPIHVRDVIAGDTWNAWDIERHGIQIDFVDTQGGRRSATYLPGVVQEQKWNKQQVARRRCSHKKRSHSVFRHQAIESLVKKSGSKDSAKRTFLLR